MLEKSALALCFLHLGFLCCLVPLTNQPPKTCVYVEWGQEVTAASLAHTKGHQLGQGHCFD